MSRWKVGLGGGTIPIFLELREDMSSDKSDEAALILLV